MKHTIKDVFRRAGGVYISDGGWGSELFKLGLPVGESPEKWNIEHEDKILEVAYSYVNAGSDIILTNSFGGNRFVLEKHGLDDKVNEINKRAVVISKKAAADKALVFASMGPTGKMVSMGEISVKEAESAFLEQANAFREAGADAIVAETMSDIEEFGAAIRAAVSTGLPVVGSMSFDSGLNYSKTMMGVSIDDMVRVATENNASMVGANCGIGIENYIGVAKEIVKSSPLPVWIKANAGLPVIENGKAVYKMTASEFGRHAATLIELGVRVIGGCCGTSPVHIKEIAQLNHSVSN